VILLPQKKEAVAMDKKTPKLIFVCACLSFILICPAASFLAQAFPAAKVEEPIEINRLEHDIAALRDEATAIRDKAAALRDEASMFRANKEMNEATKLEIEATKLEHEATQLEIEAHDILSEAEDIIRNSELKKRSEKSEHP
jgi:predicted  nucleic acid-binding Zn-ribbon protein